VPAPSTIDIEIHTPESCILTLIGEHDSASSEGLTLALVLARDYAHVLVDLTRCTFLDATILGALLTAGQRMRAADKALELIIPPRADGVYRTLELARVLPLLPIHATRSEGVGAVATAARLRTHGEPLRLRAVSAEIDQLSEKPEISRAIHAAKMRGRTIVRARVEVAAIEADDAGRHRAA
jgi:anti-anti-sigma factor